MIVVMDPQMPTGTEVASYETYAQARTGVDFLSDAGFDISAITIIGSGLHLVEYIKGHLTIARVSLSGALDGGLWGTLGSMLMSAGQSAGGTGTWVVGGTAVGALTGMALPALSFIIHGRSRDLVSPQRAVTQRYAVLASAGIDHVYQILQRTSGNRVRVVRSRTEQARPQKDSVGSFPDGHPRFDAATKDREMSDGRRTPEVTSARTDVPVNTPDISTPMTNSPKSAVSAHEDVVTSSLEEDQTEA